MISTAVTTFDFNSATIRVVDLNGNPWFVAPDAYKQLGLGLSSQSHFISRLADDEKGYHAVVTPGGVQRARIISESGLYKLVMRSDKPEARQFQDWVTRVVLPAIRKDGAYHVGEEKIATGELSEDEFLLRAFEMLKRKADRLHTEKLEAEARAVVAEAKQDEMRTVFGEKEHTVARMAATLGPGVNVNKVKESLAKEGFLRFQTGAC